MQDGVASTTARRVAAHRLTFDRVPSTFGDAAADERLSRDVASGVDVSGSTDWMTAYLHVRTQFFDTVVMRAIGRGVTQIVVAAAGYDGRALRYASPGVRWYELDHPDTQRDKRARLDRLDIDSSQIRFVPADFRFDDITAALRGAGLEPSVPTLFTIEGVVVYLDRAVVATLFSSLRAFAAPASRAAVSISSSSGGPQAAVRRQRFQAAVAAMGEPAMAPLTVDEADGFFAATGWSPQPTDDDRPLASRAGLIILQPTDSRSVQGHGRVTTTS